MAGSRGTGPASPKPRAVTSWSGASAAPAAPSSVVVPPPPPAGARTPRRPPTQLKVALRHKEASQGIAGGQAPPGQSPKLGLWAPGGPRCGSSPPGSASTPRRSRRRTSGTLPTSTRWTRPWRAPTLPTAAGRTARRQDPAAHTHGGTGTPGLVGTRPPVPPRSRRRGLGRGRARPAVAPAQRTGARVVPQTGRGLFAPRRWGEPVAGRTETPTSIRGAARGWETPLIPRGSLVSLWTPPCSRQPAPLCWAPTSPLPLPPKRPAPRCLAGKPSSPVAAAGHRAKEPGAQSLMVGALHPLSPGARWGRRSGGVPAAPGGSRGAPSVPCPPTTATTPTGRTPRGRAEVRDPRAGVPRVWGGGCP